MMRLVFLPLTLSLVVSAGPAPAATDTICANAARNAASRTGVPLEVLLAITHVETGRRQSGRITPWPWTINDSGPGYWYATRAEAEAAAESILASGRTSFDVGCFQLNFRWHGNNFNSISTMFDPEGNALHAARFLHALYGESGDWSVAAGAYHSRTPVYARRYRNRFDTALAAFGGDTGAPPGPSREVRLNTFPLLQPGAGARAAGSLVPLGL